MDNDYSLYHFPDQIRLGNAIALDSQGSVLLPFAYNDRNRRARGGTWSEIVRREGLTEADCEWMTVAGFKRFHRRKSSGYSDKAPWADHRSLAPLCRKAVTRVRAALRNDRAGKHSLA